MPRGTKAQPGLLTRELVGIIRAQRGRTGTLQAALAADIGISQAQLSEVLNFRKQIDVDLLDRICYALNLSPDQVWAEANAATQLRFLDPDWTVKRLV